MKTFFWHTSVLVLGLLAAPSVACADQPADDEAQMIVEAFDREIAAVKKKAAEYVRAANEKCLTQLQQLQDKHTKAGKLDEAVAVRERIRALKAGNAAPLPDPGNLSLYSSNIGTTYYFEVMGATGGSIYGTDIYSHDSHLATAAVHCGVLKYGEKGVVKVTIMPGKASYESTDKNGVSSRQWGSYPASFKVESIKPTKPELPEKK